MDFGRNHAHAPWRSRRVPTALAASVALAAAAVVLVLGAVGDMPSIVAVAVAAGCAGLALAPTLIARHDRSVMRSRADRLLRGGVRVHPDSALLTWRETELTSQRHRNVLARSLGHVVRELEGRVLPGPAPLSRAARSHVDSIRALAERLAALERPVTAQGMLLVEDFVTDGFGSPLYVPERAADLEPLIERCLAALDDPTVFAKRDGRVR
jgi:hypothetical protein